MAPTVTERASFRHREFDCIKVLDQGSKGDMILRKTVTAEQGGCRLDEALSKVFEAISKTEARRIIDRGGCAVNSSMVRVASRSVKAGDVIEIGVMEAGRFKELVLPPEALLYEDAELIAVNKPAGVNTQRTPYQLKGTLEYWVSEYFRQQGSNEPCRVIHRLDRGTSGAMLFPKHKRAAAWLSARFHDNLVAKCYWALVCGHPEHASWTVDSAIGKIGSARYGVKAGGRSAVTVFRLLASSDGYSLVEARPHTGRTHQIRVHLESSRLPIVGDTTYAGAPAVRMMLHCASLAFKDERGKEILITAPLDDSFEALMSENGLFSSSRRGTEDIQAP
jgi:23S rRNA pseudouridine1911/1915/1917 synthase